MMFGWGMGWGGWLMSLFWLVPLALIVFFVLRFLPTGTGGVGGPQQDSPERILDDRFARGEIDLETYQTQREALAQARGKR
ncbi:MAG TPA: hypothetical protein VFP72_10255 [Kineosporiaceae bacterium]|nr:hypothetical protein [Kineosporiaceae bacterium]